MPGTLSNDMNLFNNFFDIFRKAYFTKEIAHNNDVITAKEKQSIVIKTCLKTTLKQHGYLTNSQTWWRDQGDFFIIINLQNFSWNTKNDVTFCFNIGIALKSRMKDVLKKPSYFDLTTHTRGGAYLSDSRKNIHRVETGYIIKSNTDVEDFIKELSVDFETEILPKLDKLKTINDCVEYYEQFPFWGDHLKRMINRDSL